MNIEKYLNLFFPCLMEFINSLEKVDNDERTQKINQGLLDAGIELIKTFRITLFDMFLTEKQQNLVIDIESQLSQIDVTQFNPRDVDYILRQCTGLVDYLERYVMLEF